MNIYFTTCNPINYSLNDNWNKGVKQVFWQYGNDRNGKFKDSRTGDVVFLMYNDSRNNNQGDILFNCVIEEGLEVFTSEEEYRRNPIDGEYVIRVNMDQPLKFYKLKMVGRTENIRKEDIINTQNPDNAILDFKPKKNNRWDYPQKTKTLSNNNYLNCPFSQLLLKYNKELNLTDEVINLLKTSYPGTQDDVQTMSVPIKESNICQLNKPRNLIVFGAPGTGKSHYLNDEINKKINDETKAFEKVERVTFYPSYSYSQFVGCYKPIMKGENISYSFVPGPFLRTYVEAIENPTKNYLLVIEEINRADAASVFGDVFQLLDRDENGKSVYSISTSEDIKKYLEGEKISSDNISIPSNMYIWATMNSADQGVFPMDTAFKRRWDFLYFDLDGNPIEDNDNCPVTKNNWENIRKAINDWLCEKKVNEDKHLGKYFINVGENEEEKDFRDAFKNKVLMYLYEDAARAFRSELFVKNSFSEILSDFNINGTEIFRPESIKSIANRVDNVEERAAE